MPEKAAILRQIRDEAARWVADRDSGLLSHEDDLRLEAWLAEDPVHRRAYERAERLWSALDAIEETPGMRPPRPVAAVNAHHTASIRRNRMGNWRHQPRGARKVAAAVAACVALLVSVPVLDIPMRLQADARTGTGEQRIVNLPDGSVVQLNTNSAIAFDYQPGARNIELLRGEAAFTVTPDKSRPFRVKTSEGVARALGTRFIVRRYDDGASVSVTEHRVAVSFAESRRELKEGQRVSYSREGGLTSPTSVDVADADAWTRGRLIVVNRPLGEVIDELSRYHHGYMRISKDAGRLRVSGNFRTNDALAALEQIRKAVPIEISSISNVLIYIHK